MAEQEERQKERETMKKRKTAAKSPFEEVMIDDDNEMRDIAAKNSSRPIADLFPETTIQFCDLGTLHVGVGRSFLLPLPLCCLCHNYDLDR